MPNMDGPTATRNIREMGYKGIVVGVTGNALEEDRESFLKSGVNEVLVKPLNFNALYRLLANYGCIA